jgi:PilZ domain
MANTEKIFYLTHDLESSGGQLLMNDRRASKRIHHEAPLVIENCDSGTCCNGRMYNFSQGGIYFESDVPFQVGARLRIDIEKAIAGLDAARYYADVKWSVEISAAVVLYDYGIGVEFDPQMRRSTGKGKLRVIAGGLEPDKP